jgi:hypothetical protein
MQFYTEIFQQLIPVRVRGIVTQNKKIVVSAFSWRKLIQNQSALISEVTYYDFLFIALRDPTGIPSGNSASLFTSLDRLCGLVVRVLGYGFGGPGSIPGTTRFSGKKKKRKTSSGSGTGFTQPREYN